MKTGALVLGIIGGLIALLYGTFGYGVGSFLSSAGAQEGGIMKLLSVGLPIAALVGAGMVKARPAAGALLMGGSAIALIAILGFNFFSLIPVVLLGLGALLGIMGAQEPVKN